MTGAPPRRWLQVAAIAVGVLLVAEVTVRLIEDRLPEPVAWLNIESQLKAEQIDALAAAGGADLAIVGSSVANSGLDPVTAATELGLTAYDAGLSAAYPALAEPWTVRLVLPRLRPRIVLYGVTSADFSVRDRADDLEAALRRSHAGGELLGTNGVLDHLDDDLASVSALWRNRASLRDFGTMADVLGGEHVVLEGEFGTVEPTGFVAFAHSTRPFDAPGAGPPIESWSLSSANIERVRRVIEAAQATGATVVLVDMPVTDEMVARHPHGDADYELYLSTVRALAADTGATLLEHNAGMRDHANFADVIHLNREGAAELMHRIAEDLRRLGIVPLP